MVVMFRCTRAPDRSRRKQLCLPNNFHEVVLKSLHDDCGHLGFDKTYGFVKESFYWPRMKVQWGKKVFSQPPIVQVLPLKKMREACNFHHRYTSTMRDKMRKKIPENHIVGF